MNLLKTSFASAALLAGGILATAPQNADAGVRVFIGGGRSAYYGGYGYGGYTYPSYGYAYPSYGFGSPYGGYGGPVWHNTSHYDYHPGYAVPHGNHFDVVPGHYHHHNTGHWH